MTLSFLLPAVWGFVLLIAFIGYGKLMNRFLFVDEKPGWANEAAWGMAFIVTLGGWLNLFYLISPPLVIFLILFGVSSGIYDLFRIRKSFANSLKAAHDYWRTHPFIFILKFAGYGIIVILAGIQYLGSVTTEVHHWNYIVMDDLRGYFLLPKQMLETGGITADPFNSMRLGNGLAGQAMLHAMMLVVFDFFNILLVEFGVSLIICVGLVWSIATNRGLSYPWKWALVFFFLCLPYYPSLVINTSSFISGMLMLLALFAFLDREEFSSAQTPVRNVLVIGLLASCAIALKTTFLPPVFMILALSYIWYLASSRFKKTAVLETLAVPIFVLIMLLPWMLSLLNSSGTMLNPILGTGYSEYNYGNYISDSQIGGFSLSQKLTFIWLTFFSRDTYLMLLIAGIIGVIVARPRQRIAPHAFVLGILISSVAILLNADLTKPPSLNRYIYGVVYVALTVVIMELMAVASRRSTLTGSTTPRQRLFESFTGLKKMVAIVTLAGMGYLFFWQFGYAGKTSDFYQFYLNILPNKMSSQGVFFPEEWQARYRKAQETVPEGETILSRDIATAAYDFGRNHIFYMPLPGSSSPPPGMPYFAGPDKIADYLLSYNVRYVAYHYALDGGLPIMENIYRIRPDAAYYNRILQRAAMALDKALNELAASRVRLHDDGSLFIIDLKNPAPLPSVYRAPNYFQKTKILTPAVANTSGFDRNKIWTNGHGVIEDIQYQPDATDRFLVLHTFGYHPWKEDMKKLRLGLSVNGRPLPFVGYLDNSYYFSLAGLRAPITNITIDSSTFVPRDENIRFGLDDDKKTLGIDVDTIEIKAAAF